MSRRELCPEFEAFAALEPRSRRRFVASRLNRVPAIPRRVRWLCVLFCAVFWSGCAAFKPVEGVPVSNVPPEYLAPSRQGKRTINPSLLQRSRPADYRLDAGDVLAVHIEGVLIPPDSNLLPPVHFPEKGETPPSWGFPIPVRQDGSVSIPQLGSVMVRGMTVPQVEQELRQKFIDKEILRHATDQVVVNLQRPRTYRILVVRQEGGTPTQNSQIGGINPGALKRGTGQVVNLPAYENDVLNAIARTNGLPGLDAENAIYVIRRRPAGSGHFNGLPSAPPLPCDPGDVNPAEPAFPSVYGSDDYGLNSLAAGQSGNSILLASATVPDQSSYRTRAQMTPPNLLMQPTQHVAAASRRYGHSVVTADFERSANGLANQRIQPISGRYGNTAFQSTTPAVTNAVATSRYGGGTIQPGSVQQTAGGFDAMGTSRYGHSPVSTSADNMARNQRSQPNPLAGGRYGLAANPSGLMPLGAQPVNQSLEPIPMSQPIPPNNGLGQQPSAMTPSTSMSPYGYPVQLPPGQPSMDSHQQPMLPAMNGRGGMTSAPFDNSTFGRGAMAGPAAGSFDTGTPILNGGIAYEGGSGATIGPPPDATMGQSLGYPVTGFSPGVMVFGGVDLQMLSDNDPNMVRIPVRLGPNEIPRFTEQDVTLEDGDIVFIESRDSEVYYTGGLLGGGQYTLPRDYDVDILEAISLAQNAQNGSRGARSIGGISALNQDVTVSASHAVVIRKLPNGCQIPIKVDLYRAIRCPADRMLIQPGDMIVLQYSKLEAIGAFIERHLLEGALFTLAASQLNQTGGGGGQ